MRISANSSKTDTQYLSVKEVAEILHKCPSTIRIWDKKGILTAIRQPKTNYRLYQAGEVAKLVEKLGSNKTGRRLLP